MPLGSPLSTPVGAGFVYMIFSAVSRSPFRLSATLQTTPSTTASDYVITRADGADVGSLAVTHAFLTDPYNGVELTLSAPLVADVSYVLTYQGNSVFNLIYRQSLLQSQVPVAPVEDPEAEAFGVDIDWMADALAADGDTPDVRGRQCMVNDLAVIALVQKGEIFHRPDAGAGAKLNVNGPMTDRNVKQVVGTVTREWYKDPRVRQGGVEVRASVSAATGQLTLTGTILPLAIDDPTIVKLPGGGT